MSDEPQNGQINEEAVSTSEPEQKEEFSLPDDVQERTREQFEKLKAKNKELAEQLRAKETPKSSVLEELYPQENTSQYQPTGNFQVGTFDSLSQKQVKDIQDDFTYVGDDGYKYIDQAKLSAALKEANERAEKAAKSAQIANDTVRRFEETQQVRETYQSFPQLNPNSTEYDQNFYNLVKGELMNQAMRGEKNLMKAAKTISESINAYRGQGTQQAQAQKVQTQKEQINATTSAHRGTYSSADIEELVRGTMLNRPGALAERLKRSGY